MRNGMTQAWAASLGSQMGDEKTSSQHIAAVRKNSLWGPVGPVFCHGASPYQKDFEHYAESQDHTDPTYRRRNDKG